MAMGSQQVVDLALAYPFQRPTGSFVLVAGKPYYFDVMSWNNPDWTDLKDIRVYADNVAKTDTLALQDVLRQHNIDGDKMFSHKKLTPILAIGSNSSPEQLLRKYPINDFPNIVIPVVGCTVHDYDIVYSSIICSYGSIPATIQYSKGTNVRIYVTWLLPDIMTKMNSTEGGYDLMRFENAVAILENNKTVQPVLCYCCKWGSLLLPTQGAAMERELTSLAEISADNRIFKSMTQEALQEQLLAQLVETKCDLATFVEQNVKDDELRKNRRKLIQDKGFFTNNLAYGFSNNCNQKWTKLQDGEWDHYLSID